MHRGMHRGVHNYYSLKKFLKHTVQGLITLLKGEEEEMLSGKNTIHLRDRGYIKIRHTTPEEAKKTHSKYSGTLWMSDYTMNVTDDARVTLPQEDTISLQTGGEITVSYGETGLIAWFITLLTWYIYEVITQGRG